MVRLRSVAGVRNRQARQKSRRGILLRDAGITKATQSRYYTAVSLLCKSVQTADDMEDLDEQVGDWIEEQFQKGSPLNTGADALSGLHFFVPSTRKRLPGAWRLFGTWRKMETPARAPPLPEDLLWAMVSYAVQNRWFEIGVLLATGFHCFLRTGELLALRPCDFLLKNGRGIVNLPASKGGTRNNVRESVTILDPVVAVLLEDLIEAKRSCHQMKVPIWNRSGTKFREDFAAIVAFFGVEHLKFRPYSLRRGGATAYFSQHGLMERTLLRGRWASVSVARLYLCDARCAGTIAKLGRQSPHPAAGV